MTGGSLVDSDVSVSKFENPTQYVRLILCGSKTWFVDWHKYCKSLIAKAGVQWPQNIASTGYYQTSLNIPCGAEQLLAQPQGCLFCSHVLCVLFKVIPMDFSNHCWPPDSTGEEGPDNILPAEQRGCAVRWVVLCGDADEITVSVKAGSNAIHRMALPYKRSPNSADIIHL